MLLEELDTKKHPAASHSGRAENGRRTRKREEQADVLSRNWDESVFGAGSELSVPISRAPNHIKTKRGAYVEKLEVEVEASTNSISQKT